MPLSALPDVGSSPATEGRGASTDMDDEEAEEILRDAASAFGELFSVHPPRDAFAGVWSGVKCILSGAFLGIAGVIMQPIQGARTDGVIGCFKGVFTGLFTGLFFSLTGLSTGMFQAVRGVAATPRAICMVGKGYRWDGAKYCWEEPLKYSLPDEASRVFPKGVDATEESDDDGLPEGPSARRRVADTYLYDQLCVSPNASQRDIRRAYFQQSRRWHPDKSQEPDAKEKFQAISEAYQVLSEPTRRRDYDAKGHKGQDGAEFVDAKVFFSVLLGADALEPFLGRLRIADFFGEDLLGLDEDEDLSANVASERRKHRRDRTDSRQTRREVKLAISLVDRVAPFVEGDVGFFADKIAAEVEPILRKDPTLERFIAEIGWMYRHRADLFIARLDSPFGVFGFRSLRLRLYGGSRQARQGVETANLAVRSLYKLQKIVKDADNLASSSSEHGEDAADDIAPESFASAFPTFIETFFSICSHDINGTLRRVVDRVFNDTSVPLGITRLRALAVRELGIILLQKAATARTASTSGKSSRAGDCPAAEGSASASKTGATQGVGGSDDERKRKRFEDAFRASMGGATGQ